jgi:hypothetical protein
MGHVDRQRISAVKRLEGLGHAWHQGARQQVHGNDFVAEGRCHACVPREARRLARRMHLRLGRRTRAG